jgi:hypothetical protein
LGVVVVRVQAINRDGTVDGRFGERRNVHTAIVLQSGIKIKITS